MACPPASEPRIRLLLGDITRIEADAIVNAANRSLLGGGGVDGAIHRAAGPELLVECRSLGGCQPGEARLTRGYRLPAAFVIHTVGPIWQGGNAGERSILEGCYRSSLAIAHARRFSRIAFPAIATGVYGFPREAAAEIAVAATRNHLAAHETPHTVIFACFDEATLSLSIRAQRGRVMLFEALVVEILARALLLLPTLVAVVLAPAEAHPVFRRLALRLGALAPFAVLIEIDDHWRPPAAQGPRREFPTYVAGRPPRVCSKTSETRVGPAGTSGRTEPPLRP